MKSILLIIQLIVSLSIFGQEQEIETKIISVDTLTLGEFNQKKVLLYEVENAKICINAEDYLLGIEIFDKRYKKWVKETKKGDSEYEFYNTNYKVIDSVYKYVKKGIKRKDTILVSHKVFDKIGLSSLVDFDHFIDNGKCAVYDENGNRQYKIVRKYETYYSGPVDAWGGRRYYLINKKKYFFEGTDWVS